MTRAGGTYTLVLERWEGGAVEVGALGHHRFPAGWYAYTGSALGPGGFARVDRHRRLAAGEHAARHWHVDSLLGESGTAIDAVVESAGVDAECAVARAIESAVEGDDATGAIELPAGFGSSDCPCEAHLVGARRRDALFAAVASAHESVRQS